MPFLFYDYSILTVAYKIEIMNSINTHAQNI